MIRNLKALGICMAAVFAISAITASTAVAETTQVASFTASQYPAKITGTQEEEHKFTIGSSIELSCQKSHFHAELTAASTSLTVIPTYEKCKFKFGATEHFATVTLNECYYTFTVHSGSGDSWSGDVHIKCPPEKSIEIHVFEDEAHTKLVCTYVVEPQTVETGISYTNNTETGDVTIAAKEAPTKVKKTSGTLAHCGAGEQTAKYTGNVTATATNEAGGSITGSIVAGMP